VWSCSGEELVAIITVCTMYVLGRVLGVCVVNGCVVDVPLVSLLTVRSRPWTVRRLSWSFIDTDFGQMSGMSSTAYNVIYTIYLIL
jgi:hypothetical protein